MPSASSSTSLIVVRPALPARRATRRVASIAPPAASASASASDDTLGVATPGAAIVAAWSSLRARIWRTPSAEEVEVRGKERGRRERTGGHPLLETHTLVALLHLPQSINAAFKTNWRNMRRLAIVAPLASMTGGGAEVLVLLTRSVASFVKLYLLFLFLRVLLSWFPAFNWDRQPWMALRQLTDPYLNVFRGFVPPLFGSVDFTPLLGFFVLQTVEGYLEWLAFSEEELNEGYPDGDY